MCILKLLSTVSYYGNTAYDIVICLRAIIVAANFAFTLVVVLRSQTKLYSRPIAGDTLYSRYW